MERFKLFLFFFNFQKQFEVAGKKTLYKRVFGGFGSGEQRDSLDAV